MYLQTLSRGVDKLEMRHGFAAGDQNLDFNSYISTKISTLIVLGFKGGTNSPPIWLINKFFSLKDYIMYLKIMKYPSIINNDKSNV